MNSLPQRAFLLAVVVFAAATASAAPVTQNLSRSSSSITFGVESNAEALRMNGSLKEFTGSLIVDPADVESAQLRISATLSSAILPPNQLMQALLLQSLLARVEHKQTTFESTAVEHTKGTQYIMHGKYSWSGKEKSVSIPVEIARISHKLTEIRVIAREAFQPKHTPQELAQLAQGARGSIGWANAKLIFLPR